eukprot:477591-Pleurochrysis_carterae.AAC.3
MLSELKSMRSCFKIDAQQSTDALTKTLLRIQLAAQTLSRRRWASNKIIRMWLRKAKYEQ